MRRATIIATLALAVLLGGCSTRPSGKSANPPRVEPTYSSTWVKAAGDVTLAGTFYPETNVRLLPAPSATTPKLTAADAWQDYLKSGIFPGVAAQASGPPDIQLVLFSNDTMGDIQPDGTVKPKFQNVLTWVIILHNVPWTGLGGAIGQQAPPSPMPEDIVIAIDANTGLMMDAFVDVVGPPRTPDALPNSKPAPPSSGSP